MSDGCDLLAIDLPGQLHSRTIYTALIAQNSNFGYWSSVGHSFREI